MQKISKSWIIPSLLGPLWLSWHLQDLDLPRPNLSPKSSCESNSFLRNLVILAFAILATFGHFLLHTFLQLHVGFGWGLPNFLYYELNLIPRRPNLSPKSSMQCIACESNTEFGFFLNTGIFFYFKTKWPNLGKKCQKLNTILLLLGTNQCCTSQKLWNFGQACIAILECIFFCAPFNL